PERTEMLYSHIAFQTIHMTGTRAKAIPFNVELAASLTGICHTQMAIIRPMINPASAACQAGRRKTPINTRTTAIGINPTRKERKRFPATGARIWWNISISSLGKAYEQSNVIDQRVMYNEYSSR